MRAPNLRRASEGGASTTVSGRWLHPVTVFDQQALSVLQALVKLGTSKAELEEVLGMAVYMGGGPSLMYSANALMAFEEFSVTP